MNNQSAIVRTLVFTAAIAIVSACGAAPVAGTPTGGPASSTVALSCISSGAASPSWPAPEAVSTSAPAIASAKVTGDVLSLTFAQGTPQFAITQASSTHFTMDPSGRAIDLPGTSGVTITLKGFRGDASNYAGQTSLSSSGPLLLRTERIGDFEGVVTFAAGLSAPSCANVAANGSTLTFTFIPAH